MSVRVDVLLWANRITARRSEPAHKMLEIAHDATLDDAQNAFHKIARMAHPDLHRTTLNAEELEIVTTAYALAASAYQQFRMQRAGKPAVAKKPGEERAKRPSGGVSLPGGGVVGRGRTPSSAPSPSHAPAAPPAPAPPAPPALAPVAGAAQQMSSKAVVHYRKAESALRQGDVRAAVLSIKMAIAADPQSAFLRTALAEVQAELAKKP